MTILVFPSCLEGCLPFLQEARRHGQRLVGASSLDIDPYEGWYDAWERLPNFRDVGFPEALVGLVRRQGIDQIFTSHAPTYNFLSQSTGALPSEVSLMGPSPNVRQSDLVRAAWDGLPEKIAKIDSCAGQQAGYSPAFVAGLMHQANALYGECREEKALALCGVLADAPQGDIVEIGTFFGKSAFLLNRIAAYRAIGPTLAVDPWDLQTSIQKDSPPDIQELSEAWNWNVVFQGFLLTMAASAAGSSFNYLRMPSASAWAVYDGEDKIRSPEFGETQMTGRIALLHIDGNHDKAAVMSDFALWSRRLADGGWIVFDDYLWTHGGGPRVIADQAVADYGDRVRRRFVSGGALFLKIAAEV